jgi:hypothetical protein
MMNETQLRFLRSLRDAQPSGLRKSSVPKSCGRLVESLQTCGAIAFAPSGCGRGVVLHIGNPAAFLRFVSANCPQGLDVDTETVVDRASAVFTFADAKAIRRGAAQGIFVRATKQGVTMWTTDGKSCVDVSAATAQAGGAGIQLSQAKTWTFAGSVAIVENAETFWKHELALPDAEMAIFVSGQMSDRLMTWLSGQEMASCSITHWGDYDPFGVNEYLRLVRACGSRVSAHAPREVDDLLVKFGKRKLVIDQARYLDRLRPHQADPYVRRMTKLFDTYRRGLEQEIFLRLPATV